MRAGRSFRFLGATVGGWTLIRTAMLWPTIDSVPALIDALVPSPAAAEIVSQRIVPKPRDITLNRKDFRPPTAAVAEPAPPLRPPFVTVEGGIALAPAAQAGFGTGTGQGVPAPGNYVAPPPPTPWIAPRFAASAWAIVRPGGGAATGFGGTLGASQAGVRATYAIDGARRLAVMGRLSTALGSRQREAAVGVDWRPTALPVHLVAERRIARDGGRDGTAFGAIAGVNPTAIGAGFRLEAYGQAGVILRGGSEGFADGALRIATGIAPGVDIGAGAWGAAQRGAARFDIGPSVQAVVPIGTRRVRIALEWRERVAGAARPGSGPALSIGSDF